MFVTGWDQQRTACQLEKIDRPPSYNPFLETVSEAVIRDKLRSWHKILERFCRKYLALTPPPHFLTTDSTQADRAAAGAGGGFSLFGGRTEKYENAADLYTQAANAFRMQKQSTQSLQLHPVVKPHPTLTAPQTKKPAKHSSAQQLSRPKTCPSPMTPPTRSPKPLKSTARRTPQTLRASSTSR